MSILINKGGISSNVGIVIATLASAVFHLVFAYSYLSFSKTEADLIKTKNKQPQAINFTVIPATPTATNNAPQQDNFESEIKTAGLKQTPIKPVSKKTIKNVTKAAAVNNLKKPDSKAEKKPLPVPVKIARQPVEIKPVQASHQQSHNEAPSLIVETTALKEIEELYITRIMNQIEKNKFYPRKARKRNIEGTVLVTLAIDNNGQIASMDLSESHIILRKAAKKAILQSQPFIRPPSALLSPKKISFAMTYRFKDF